MRSVGALGLLLAAAAEAATEKPQHEEWRRLEALDESAAEAGANATNATRRALQSKSCTSVPPSQCGTNMGVNTCLHCAPGSVCESSPPTLRR